MGHKTFGPRFHLFQHLWSHHLRWLFIPEVNDTYLFNLFTDNCIQYHRESYLVRRIPIISFSHLKHVFSKVTTVGSQSLVEAPWGPSGDHREPQLFSIWPQTPALLSGTSTLAVPTEMSVWQSGESELRARLVSLTATCDGWHNEWHSMQIIFTQW